MNVVVAVDGSDESLAALDWALHLAAGLEGRLVAVHAVGLLEESGYRQQPDVSAIVDDARQRVPAATGAPVEVVYQDGPAAEVIVRVADAEAADVIVIGSRGIGQAARQLGSVSEAVFAHAHLPVLVVPRT